MASTIWFHLYVESKKQNKQRKQKHTYRYKEHFDGCQMGVGLEGWVKKGRELKSTNR